MTEQIMCTTLRGWRGASTQFVSLISLLVRDSVTSRESVVVHPTRLDRRMDNLQCGYGMRTMRNTLRLRPAPAHAKTYPLTSRVQRGRSDERPKAP